MATKICYWWSRSVVYNEGSPRTSVQVLQVRVPSCPVGDDTAFFWRGPDHPHDRQSATEYFKQLQGKASAAKTNIY